MLSSTVLAIVALFSLGTSAPTAEQHGRPVTDRSTWVSVDFHGSVIQYDPARLILDPGTTLSTHKTTLSTRQTPTTDNTCGPSTFTSGIAPYPVTTDCQALEAWAYSLNAYWSIWTNTPDYHGVAGAGSCEFGAGTRNDYDTYVGSSDMGDLISSSISMFQVRCSNPTEMNMPKKYRMLIWCLDV